jgi:hypothetical protein
MKPRVLNRSFGKVLAAAAIAFMISTASALAQQGWWGTDGCFYVTVVNRLIPAGQPGYFQQYRAGCNVRNAVGRIFYHDEINQTWKDLRTGELYQVAADGCLYLWTTAGRREDRAAASGTQKAGQEQSAGNPQAIITTQQALRQQTLADFLEKQLHDAQEQHQRSTLNLILPCSGEKNYLDCVDKDRELHGFNCYSSRDMNTNYCQRKANDKAAVIRRDQQEADARAATIKRNQQVDDATAAVARQQQQAADARAADARAAAARDEERRRDNAWRK